MSHTGEMGSGNNRLKKKYDNTENFIKEESSGEEGGNFQTEDEGAGGMRINQRNPSMIKRKRNMQSNLDSKRNGQNDTDS